MPQIGNTKRFLMTGRVSFLADWRERYRQLWERFDQRQRYIILGAVVLILVAIVGVGFWFGSKPEMVPLFTNMEAKDAGEVAANLQENQVQYKIEETPRGTTILVPATNVHDLRMSLAVEGLPRGNKGFELFDDSKLGVTEFQNKVNYLQAIQGELTRTIEQIHAVQKARVHIVMQEDSLYKKNEKPATASIMLMLMPDLPEDEQLTKKEIKGIVNLVAHSVQSLQPENITIVDDTGKILNDPDDEESLNVSNMTLTQVEMTRRVENRLQRNLQSLLDRTLGEHKAVAQVSVELDFDQRQTDRQIFTPVVDESGIIRSQQDISETYSGNSTIPGGAAGVQSNVPGYIAENGNANADYSRQESIRNYEINEEKQKIIASPGSIRRLTVAVLVDESVNATQQDSLVRAVSSAVGLNPERGDTISVEPLPFSTEAEDRRAALEAEERARKERQFYIAIGLLVLLLLAALAYYLWRRKKRLQAEAEEEEARRQAELEQQRIAEELAAAEAAAAAAAEEEAAAEEAAMRAAMAAAAGTGGGDEGEVEQEEELTEEEKRQLSEKQAIMELIDTRPAEVAMLVKTWLAEDE